jgi:hypothetical protein
MNDLRKNNPIFANSGEICPSRALKAPLMASRVPIHRQQRRHHEGGCKQPHDQSGEEPAHLAPPLVPRRIREKQFANAAGHGCSLPTLAGGVHTISGFLAGFDPPDRQALRAMSPPHD